jgi:hypothetical protein
VTVLYEATPVGVLPEVQNGMAERNAGLPPDRRIELRVGIHLGDVVEESDGDLMGDGVNIAARLDGIAKPGAICLSEDAYRQMRDRLQHEFIDLGEKGLKNIARPVRAYTIKIDSAGSVVPAQASGQDKAGHPRLSIVIAPFTNIGGDSEQEYFVDGVTESLTTDLSRISGVRSRKIARTGRSRCDRPIAYPHRPQSAREGAPVHGIIIAHDVGRPAPIGAKAGSMPPQYGARLDHLTQTEQVRPKLCHPDQQRLVIASQSRTAGCMLQGHVQLLSEKKILHFKSAPRPEQVADKGCKQMEDREHAPHHAMILPPTANPRG